MADVSLYFFKFAISIQLCYSVKMLLERNIMLTMAEVSSSAVILWRQAFEVVQTISASHDVGLLVQSTLYLPFYQCHSENNCASFNFFNYLTLILLIWLKGFTNIISHQKFISKCLSKLFQIFKFCNFCKLILLVNFAY